MSLWVKRTGLLMMATALLIFLSCEEPISLGYKAKDRFDVFYTEIPLTSTVFHFDSVFTTNFDTPYRLLVGSYNDTKFGTVTTTAYTQFWRVTVPDSLSYGTFDSVRLYLKLDTVYLYGSPGATLQEFTVHELEDTLGNVLTNPRYYSKSSIPYNSTPLGSLAYTLDPDDFDDTLSLSLADEFGSRLFESAKIFQNPSNAADSASWSYDNFRKTFKGLAFKYAQGDKIISHNLASSASKIVVYFHINKKDSIVLNFSGLTSFNQVEHDRSASEISSITDLYTDYSSFPDRYVQSGVGVTTKISFANFFEKFVDTLTVSHIGINSAELVIEDVYDHEALQPPPPGFILRILRDDNRFKGLVVPPASAGNNSPEVISYNNAVNEIGKYQGTVSVQPSPYTINAELQNSSLLMGYSKDNKAYNGFLTLFVQQLFNNRVNGPRFTELGLYPSTFSGEPTSASLGKSVNRVSFPSESVKLRLYYTRPTLDTQN